MSSIDQAEYFDLNGLSAYSSLGVGTLRDHIRAGGLPCFKVKGKLGTGKRFERLKRRLAGRKGVTDPEALAAHIGRRKFGKGRFAKLGAKARKKKR